MTVEPANLEAIFATKFNDFGKGEELYQNWKLVSISAAKLI